MTPASCLTSGSTPVVHRVQEASDKSGVEVLRETEIKKQVERVAPGFARDVADRAICEPGILRLHRRGDDHAIPIPLKDRARDRAAQVFAEAFAEARVAEHRLQLLAVVRLDRVEGRMAIERIGGGQREIERQWLAGKLQIHFLAARLRRGAGIEHADAARRELLVIERQPGRHEHAAAVSAGDVGDRLDRDRAGGNLDNAAPRSAHRPDQRLEFRDVADRGRHRDAAPAGMVRRIRRAEPDRALVHRLRRRAASSRPVRPPPAPFESRRPLP